MQAAIKGEDFAPCEIPYRQDEKYWVMKPSKDDVLVFFSLNFHTKMERVLARILTIEMSGRTFPNVTFHDRVEDRDPKWAEKYPVAAKESYTNGMLSVSK